jgi:hypothetical protein
VIEWARRIREEWADKRTNLDWWVFWEARWREYERSWATLPANDSAMAEAEARRKAVAS